MQVREELQQVKAAASLPAATQVADDKNKGAEEPDSRLQVSCPPSRITYAVHASF